MPKQYHIRPLTDRRSGEDLRRVYSLDYFMHGGSERRTYKDRRKRGERRSDWIQVTPWYSVYVGLRV
jgi:hypothetical protein